MQAPPATLLSRYRARLNEEQIQQCYIPHYIKWFRYYWDFCLKQGRESASEENLAPFIDKLKQKGQGQSLQMQARKAVRLFYAIPKDALLPLPSPHKPANMSRFIYPDGIDLSEDWQNALKEMENAIRIRHYSPKTLSSYINWVKRFAAFHADRSPLAMSSETARAFLTDLAVSKKVAASTQNQAFNALLFFYRHILKADYELGDTVVRAKTSKYIPTVLNHDELNRVLENMRFPFDLIVSLLYGCGLRLSECLNLRVNCLNFDQNLVIVHDGKGMKDRSLPMPQKLRPELEMQVMKVGCLLERDLKVRDFGGVFLPPSVRSKSAAKQLQWQWVFPAKMLTLVPNEGCYRRYHNHDKHVGAAIRMAVRKAKVPKRVTAHTFRHTFASHLLAANVDLRTIQQLLGHSDIRTTMIYTHTVSSRTRKEMVSPLDL